MPQGGKGTLSSSGQWKSSRIQVAQLLLYPFRTQRIFWLSCDCSLTYEKGMELEEDQNIHLV